MKRKVLIPCVILAAATLPVMAFAQDAVDTVNLDVIAKAIIDLVANYKALGGLGVASAIISILSLIANSFLFKDYFDKSPRRRALKSLIVLILGQVFGLLQMIVSGSSVLEAIFLGIIASGGAVAIYEGFKSLKNAATAQE